jgi:hypothetical protein
MNVPERIDRALARLSHALDHLEAAAARRAEGDAARANLEDELAVMQDDRARLAVELDGALARAEALGAANGEVAVRLGRMSIVVETLLGDLTRGAGPFEPM